MDVRRLLTDQIERLWGAGELGLVRRNYLPEVVDHMPVPGQVPGLDGMEQVVREFRAAMPDLRMELHGVIVAGDLGCDFWMLTGTHAGPLFGRPPTGARVAIGGVDMVRVADGRIAELWHVEEMAQFEAQLRGERFAPPAVAVAPSAGTAAPRPIGDAAVGAAAAVRAHVEGARIRGAVDPGLYAPGFRDATPLPGQAAGLPGLLDAHARFRAAAPGPIAAEAYLVDGDLAVGRWATTGARRVNGMDVVRLDADGLIAWTFHVEEWAAL